MALIDASKLDLAEKVVAINRVSKTVKGGRIMKFSALVVVGDQNGTIGFGIGKSSEVPDAIRKGIEDAKKNLHHITLRGTTIPHEVVGKFGAGEVLMKPAPKGTGVIAGGAVRDVMEVAGIRDVLNASDPTILATLFLPPCRVCFLFAMRSRLQQCAAKPLRKSWAKEEIEYGTA